MLALWRPMSSLLDANRSFGFCLECVQRQGCPWHRRTEEGQTGFDFEWWANIIQKMMFELCPHAPETWKWECDSFYNQGPTAGERLRVTASRHSLGGLWALTWLLTSTTPLTCLTTTSYQLPDSDRASAQLWLIRNPHYGEKHSCRAGIPVKRKCSRKNSEVQQRSACSETLIWTVPLNSTLELPRTDSDGSALQP